MKLPETYFANLSNTRYRQYLNLLPKIKQENTQLLTMLILTFLAFSFFGMFAINPTLITIIDLQKELSDNEATHDQLTTKIANLSALEKQYLLLSSDLPYLDEAIPREPNVTELTGQISKLATQSHLTIRSFRTTEVTLTPTKTQTTKSLSYLFTLEAEGTYDDMMGFTKNLTNFNRIVTIDELSISRDTQTNALVLNVHGRQYFKP